MRRVRGFWWSKPKTSHGGEAATPWPFSGRNTLFGMSVFEQNCGDETRLRSGQRVGRGVGVRDFGSALEFFGVQSEQGGHRLGVRADDFRRADGTDVAGLAVTLSNYTYTYTM